LSNIASAFVGQVEAQIMIQPYLKGMTKSELMASMTGSFACISGGVMAAYIGLGVPAEYLLAASIMAAPGALAISKIIFPETEKSETAGEVSIQVVKAHSNLVDAISAGCSDGLKIGLNVAAMLIGFLALIALINAGLGKMGGYWGDPKFSLDTILGTVFSGFAWCMGVQSDEIFQAGAFMGQKLVANEFVAYNNLSAYLPSTDPSVIKQVALVNGHAMSPKTIAIVSFALCGFANFGSMGIQIGGIGALEPSRRQDLTKIVFRALIAGTLASYMSATLAGMLL
jgi:concentrative nucleoside transporter, CNT family